MLSLYDPQAGAVTPVVPARPGQLRTYTAGPPDGERAGPADLRAYLLTDLIRRAGEQHRLLVSSWHSADDSSDTGKVLRADCDALNIHPLGTSPGPPDPLDIGIGAGGRAGTAPRWLQTGPVRLPGGPLAGPADGLSGPADGPHAAASSQRGLDPLALRLLFLQHRYREPVSLTWDDLAAPDRLLRQWRAQVATWANSPSKPMCAQYTGDFKAAFDGDLDTPAALRTLSGLAADEEIPPGSKFEAFAHLDHLLGLDLARDIGR